MSQPDNPTSSSFSGMHRTTIAPALRLPPMPRSRTAGLGFSSSSSADAADVLRYTLRWQQKSAATRPVQGCRCQHYQDSDGEMECRSVQALYEHFVQLQERLAFRHRLWSQFTLQGQHASTLR